MHQITHKLMQIFKLLIFFVFLFIVKSPIFAQQTWIIEAPAGKHYTKIDKKGTTIIPNGRLIKPYGNTFSIAPHPYGLVLSPDGNTAVTANSGTSPLSITIIRNVWSENPEVQQIPKGAKTDKGILASVFMGLAITPDNQKVYVAGGQENKIYIFDLNNGKKLGKIDCNVSFDNTDVSHGYIGDMVLTKDGSKLYAIDQINFRLICIDTKTQKVLANIPTGRYPFGITLSPDEKTAYVANVGMYEYRWIESVDRKDLPNTALKYPPFAYQSQESIEGIDTGSLKVAGLGDPNAPESFSVWKIDLTQQKVTAKVKTGFLVGEKIEDFPAIGGSSPNSVVATESLLFVSNGNNDCISMIDTKNNKVIKNIYLQPDERIKRYRGIIPFGVTLSPDQKRLYVAESGINAVAVIDVATQKVLGHIPVGWFPSKLKVSPDGKKLIVANAKGFGSGPNGGSTFERGPEGSYIGGLMKGSVTIMDIPNDQKLKKLSQEVLENNFLIRKSTHADFKNRANNPIPLFTNQKENPIKYLIFVTKENRTYDEVFGQLVKGKGEAGLARFGYGATFSTRKGEKTLKDITVMPNHLALAKQFAISDNFYVDADHSADGHRWLADTYPNEWVETSVTAAYGGNRSMKLDTKAPGGLAFEGASGAIYPEDYNEAGSLWDHLGRNDISFWNFGAGIMFAPHISGSLDYKDTGYAFGINYPVSAPLFENTSRLYPTYNMAIPDQYRIDKFIEEFNSKWINGKDTMPQMLTVMLGADHGAGERSDAGFPYTQSYMADNDLALGRLVEFLSHTPYWKEMAIIVTEDDSQGGVDHVDAHRSLLMVISPYSKRSYVSHTHCSFGSIFKTFWNILGTPYLNQYDAGATDLADLFDPKPDFSPYQALPVDPRMFDPEKAYDPLDEEFDWDALGESPRLDDPKFLKKESEQFDQSREKN